MPRNACPWGGVRGGEPLSSLQPSVEGRDGYGCFYVCARVPEHFSTTMVSLRLRDLPINKKAGACTLSKQGPGVLKSTRERMVLALFLG